MELVELLGGCVPAECFSWTFVQLGRDLTELARGDGGEVGAAGQVLAEQSIRVLVRGMLPG
jgi:hypothetical protein